MIFDALRARLVTRKGGHFDYLHAWRLFNGEIESVALPLVERIYQN